LLEVPVVARGWADVCARFPGIAPARLVGELIRSQIGAMVNDLIAETRSRLTGIGDLADVRAAGRCLVGFSAEMREDERALKRFMYANLYHHPRQLEAARAAEGIVTGLFAAYRLDPTQMPGDWSARMPQDEPGRSRHIADFIAGMTDRYAVARYRAAVGPIDLPEVF
jgi:dGTPase